MMTFPTHAPGVDRGLMIHLQQAAAIAIQIRMDSRTLGSEPALVGAMIPLQHADNAFSPSLPSRRELRVTLPGAELSLVESTAYADAVDRTLLERMARGDDMALGDFFDRWGGVVDNIATALRLSASEADNTADEVFRRVWFEASALAARPERLSARLGAVVRDCCAAVVARRRIPGLLAAVPNAADASAPGSDLERAKLEASLVANEFSSIVADTGLSQAISYLNALTPFRFTGIYRFEGLEIVNVFLFDREGDQAPEGTRSRVADTYCLWIQETLSVVRMSNAMSDPRAREHSKREEVRSYCGGPIIDQAGNLFGTICHFDYVAHPISTSVMPTLAAVAPFLAKAIIA